MLGTINGRALCIKIDKDEEPVSFEGTLITQMKLILLIIYLRESVKSASSAFHFTSSH
jgi:hypothetical protein